MFRRLGTPLALCALLLLAAAPALAQYPPDVTTTVAVSDTTVVPGETITVTGEGFAPGTRVTITLDDTQVLAVAAVRDDGRFSAQVTIPEDIAPGVHKITAAGVDAEGQPRGFDIFITVVAPAVAAPAPALVTTGLELTTGSALALALLTLGAAALYAARRRERMTVDA